jgi:hypothetical protein
MIRFSSVAAPAWVRDLVQAIQREFRGIPDQPVRLKPYLKTELPSAAEYAGALIYVSNATGGAAVAYSNGTNWLRCDTSVTIS